MGEGKTGGLVRVSSTGKGKFQHRIHAGAHEITADEPLSMGGNDTGLAPYDLLRAALGVCKAMTLRMYADHKNWPLEGVDIYLSHETGKDGDGNKTHRFSCDITLRGDELTEEQRGRLIEIADKCPVHKTLTVGSVTIESREAQG